jgi:DinB superfamily
MATKTNPDSSIREHLLSLLKGGNAHATFEQAVEDFPEELRGVKPDKLPYSAWQLLEHLRIAQWDIVKFSRDEKHKSPDWPGGYWPKDAAPPTKDAWDKSVKQFHVDLKELEKLVEDPDTDLYAKIPHGDGQTILREALLVADHNAYHIAEIVVLRRLLGCWK